MPKPRMPHLVPSQLGEAQLALYRSIAEGPRAQGKQYFALRDEDGALRGPFQTFLLSPLIGDRLQALGAAIRYESGLDGRTRELAILAVAAKMSSEFEWESHLPIATALGLEDLEALHRDSDPQGISPLESAALRVSRAALEGDIDDLTWQASEPLLGATGIFELVALVGYYRLLATQLRVFRIDKGHPRVNS